MRTHLPGCAQAPRVLQGSSGPSTGHPVSPGWLTRNGRNTCKRYLLSTGMMPDCGGENAVTISLPPVAAHVDKSPARAPLSLLQASPLAAEVLISGTGVACGTTLTNPIGEQSVEHAVRSPAGQHLARPAPAPPACAAWQPIQFFFCLPQPPSHHPYIRVQCLKTS